MNILILAKSDYSGAGYALMDAINTHTLHKARFIANSRTRYGYPADLIRPTRDDRWKLMEWADVYNFQVGNELLPKGAPLKPTVKTYHGSEYRNHRRRENTQAKARGWVQTCLTVDLSQFGAKWIGRAMPDLSHMYNPNPGFHVVHAAAPDRHGKGKRDRKGTTIVQAALAGLGDVTLDIFHDVSNDECLRRKAKAHLYVDQLGRYSMGYGTSSLEAWALGVPVVSEAPDEVLDLMRERLGQLPFYPCHDADSLRRCIVRFRDSPGLRARWSAIGQQYLQRWHSPAFVAQRYVKLFEEAIDGFV